MSERRMRLRGEVCTGLNLFDGISEAEVILRPAGETYREPTKVREDRWRELAKAASPVRTGDDGSFDASGATAGPRDAYVRLRAGDHLVVVMLPAIAADEDAEIVVPSVMWQALRRAQGRWTVYGRVVRGD